MTPARPSSHDGAARAAMRWLNRRGRDGRAPSALSILCAGIGGALMVAQCWLVARALSALLRPGEAALSIGMLWPLLGVILLRALADAQRQGFAFEAAAAIKARLRADLVARLAALGPDWLIGRDSGAIAETITQGVEAVHSYFAAYLPQKIIAALIPLAVLVAVFPADWVSGVILLVTAPVVPLFMIIIGKGTETLNQRQWLRLARFGARVFDAISGLTTLRQFGAARREAQTIAALSEDYRLATMSVLRVAFLSSLVLEFFATISVAMVAVYVGFRLYYGELAFLPGIFALLLAPEFYRPLRDMGAQYHARMDAIGATEGLFEILRAEPAKRGEAPPPAPGEIVFEGVTCLHDEGEGLSDVTLRLPLGETLALVGQSGAGKTTLARILLGFLQPQRGRVLVAGADLATLKPDQWQQRLGWMPQRATLFAGTIAENLRLARLDASDQDLLDALRIACAEDFVRALPKGLETQIGDGGQGLSGGQIQRIAIARMALARPWLMILDEPTAALDLPTGRRMMQSLRHALPQATILLITHDVTLARMADQVAVMDHGRIVETGAPDALCHANGAFAALCRIGGEDA